jgi:hypothetical protein
VAGDYSFYKDLLGPIVNSSGRENVLVLSNPRVVLYFGSDTTSPAQRWPGRNVPAPKELEASLGDALNNLDRGLPYQFLHSAPNDYTGMGEALSAFHMARLLQYLRVPVRLTQGRFLNWDQIHKQNLIVLGAPQINDWTFRNAGSSNFNLERSAISNARPLPGESARYTSTETAAAPAENITDYAIVKMLALPYDFNLLLLAGIGSAATAGAGEFFATPEKMRPVYDRMRAAAPGKPLPANWEILLKVEVRDGYPAKTSAVAVRPASGALPSP